MGPGNLWLTPLILLPGVAMLVLSTSIRYIRLHDEVHHNVYEHGDSDATRTRLEQLMRRGRYFHNALVSLYMCVGLFAIAALLGGVLETWGTPLSRWVVLGITAAGMVCLINASWKLIRESMQSLDIIRSHTEQLLEAQHEAGQRPAAGFDDPMLGSPHRH